MKVEITVTVSEIREVTPSDYFLDEDCTEEDLLIAVENEINDDYSVFIDDNYAGCCVRKIKEKE